MGYEEKFKLAELHYKSQNRGNTAHLLETQKSLLDSVAEHMPENFQYYMQ